jgi:hypothetical protein
MQVWGVPLCAGSPYMADSSLSGLETAISDALSDMSDSPCAAEVVVTTTADYEVPTARVLPAGCSLTIDTTQVPPTIASLYATLTSAWD